MVLITSRPEYQGALRQVPGAQTIALAPLSDSDTAALLGELLGSDPSVGDVAAIIAERAAGNPFFAEEMVRELVQRGVLTGERGRLRLSAGYRRDRRAGDGSGGHRGAHRPPEQPGQADVERRVGDRSALRRASAHGTGERSGCRRVARGGADRPGEVRPRGAEYAFRHPLIRAVAYESQLKSDRAEVHRRLAAAIESGNPESVDQNAALIAEHLRGRR